MLPSKTLAFVCLASAILACDALLTEAPDPGDVLDGPVDGLTPAELAAFVDGDVRFEETFSVATGLGPIFNNISCAACHAGDGRGRPEATFSNVVVRLIPGPLDGSPTIERKAVAGAEAELEPEGVPLSRRLPPPVFGLGLIEAIPAASIVALEDPADRDGDGISGRAHWVEPAVWVPRTEAGSGPGPQLGRFTRRSRASTIFEQVVDAYHKDMGITSAYLPYENANMRATAPTSAADRVAEPEVTEAVVAQVVFYLRTLAPPAPGEMTAEREQGRGIFMAIGCALCHVPELRTGDHPVRALSNRSVELYSDLLLHDLGEDLSDGVSDGDAQGSEWRTAPLWGLRVMRDFLAGQAYLMHDGRARSVHEAIQLHGGEAAAVRVRYEALPLEARSALLDFVESR